MPASFTFRPPRRTGLLLQAIALGMLISFAIAGLERAAVAEAGINFVLSLLLALAAIALAPWLAYRVYALWNAVYQLERETLRLQWGLRVEEIPLSQVVWVRRASDLDRPLALPWPRWPGAVVGLRHQNSLPAVEFMASNAQNLILVATEARIFAISPTDPAAFLHAYQSLMELGMLAEKPGRSVHPLALLSNFWNDWPARLLITAALALSLILLMWVSLAIPSHPQLPFRFDSASRPTEYVPGVRLMLLPVINAIVLGIDLILGLFFYRRPESRIAAYMLWIAGIVTAGLFLGAVYFLLNA